MSTDYYNALTMLSEIFFISDKLQYKCDSVADALNDNDKRDKLLQNLENATCLIYQIDDLICGGGDGK